jgi:hypothetical protein
MPLFPPLAWVNKSISLSTKTHFQPFNVAARKHASPTTPPPITIKSYVGLDAVLISTTLCQNLLPQNDINFEKKALWYSTVVEYFEKTK